MSGKSNIRKINVTGETCPVPLVEARKAIRQASPGEIIEITGDPPPL
ncbi:SirA family protein, partial [candidate division MSBL1 archaeon SCGC-AAA261F19]